jgi:hypothetical protein
MERHPGRTWYLRAFSSTGRTSPPKPSCSSSFEKMVSVTVRNHLQLNRLLHPNQFGFQQNFSTECNLLASELSLGPRADNVVIPLDLTQLFCPGFTLTAGPPSSFTTDRVGCGGGALWRACNLTSFSPCLTGPLDYLFASHHKGPMFKSPGGYILYVKPRFSC